MGIFFTVDTKPDAIVFHNETVRFDLYKSEGFIRMTLENVNIPKEAYRAHLLKGLEILEAQKIGKWVIDLQHLKSAASDEQEWTQREWLPRLAKTNIDHIAIIAPKDATANQALQRVYKGTAGRRIRYDNFKNIEEAVDWLTYD